MYCLHFFYNVQSFTGEVVYCDSIVIARPQFVVLLAEVSVHTVNLLSYVYPSLFR